MNYIRTYYIDIKDPKGDTILTGRYTYKGHFIQALSVLIDCNLYKCHDLQVHTTYVEKTTKEDDA